MAEKKYVLAIDQSTQGTKGILFDAEGQLICRRDVAHEQIVNEKGWVSHDLDEIYRNTLQVVQDVVTEAGIAKEEIACLGISNQRETSAAWDRKTKEPLAKAIVWQCSRAEDICKRIENNVILDTKQEQKASGGVGEAIRQKTGMQLSPYFPAAKYAWLQENEPEVARAKQENRLCLGTIDSWLVFKLTKGEAFATDVSNASRTQLFNITDLKWDEELCGWFSVDAKTLPEVRDSNAFYGQTDFEGFFAEPVPILGVIGDSQGALYGQNCREKGLVKATYGTGSSVMMHAGDKPIVLDNGMVTSIAWGMDGKVSYVLEGNINYAGATVSWLKDNLGIITSAGETEAMAFAANPTDETYLIPAFSGLGAPYWKADAKAMLYGMSRTTGKNEIVCAALESIALQIADIVEGMQYDKGMSKSVLRVDGGATENAYLMQFQSDILQKKVEVSVCQEASAYGAALLSGEKAEIYDDKVLSDLRACQVYEPKMPESKRQEKWQGWRNAMEKVLR